MTDFGLFATNRFKNSDRTENACTVVEIAQINSLFGKRHLS